MNWDELFMTIVYTVASKSKDNNTHVGAVIVGDKNEIRSTGYNSFVRGADDFSRVRQERPEKYFWFEHAERNAIYNACLIGVSLDGCRMYTNGTPCMDCARGIVQSGIKEVIVDESWDKKHSRLWKEHHSRTSMLFMECGVSLRTIKFSIPSIKKYCDGGMYE